jgi:hypothetical protein
MNKEDLVKAIEAIEGVSKARAGTAVDMIDGETLLQINVYFPTQPPDVNIHVGDSIRMIDEVK